MSSSKKYVVVVVDGLVGSGKTTLLEKCLVPILTKKGLKVTLVREPVEKWKKTGALERFYQNPERRGFQFQTMAFHDRVRKSQEKYKKYKDTTDVFLMERSIFSDMLFMKTLFSMGTIDQSEVDDYASLWKMWEEVMPLKPDLFVYLKPDIEEVMDRVVKRARSAETGISKDYQIMLEKHHDEFLGDEYATISGLFVPCFRLETNENFRDDEKVMEKITSIIKEKIDLVRG